MQEVQTDVPIGALPYLECFSLPAMYGIIHWGQVPDSVFKGLANWTEQSDEKHQCSGLASGCSFWKDVPIWGWWWPFESPGTTWISFVVAAHSPAATSQRTWAASVGRGVAFGTTYASRTWTSWKWRATEVGECCDCISTPRMLLSWISVSKHDQNM